MAQLSKKPCKGDWSFTGDWNTRHQQQFDALQKKSDQVNPDISLVGALMSFGIADGAAYYRVAKDTPLMLEHVPVFDAYQVPYTQIRGLRRDDVIQHLKSEQRLKKLFAQS